MNQQREIQYSFITLRRQFTIYQSFQFQHYYEGRTDSDKQKGRGDEGDIQRGGNENSGMNTHKSCQKQEAQNILKIV